ncbi:Protein CASC5, partial [Acanthisitta chloris]
MNKIYADPNMENDNTEHIRGKRLSSILKTPRNPLDVLANGNELTQDITIEKRRKNSRRVSFANTIKVFQRDLKSNTAESENTGMNTLLHAPIQASVQQTEWEDAVQGTTRQDTTLIFSEENEMEMTASHTAVISRNLKDQQDDITEKIDVTSFLAGLNSSHGKAGTSKGFNLLSEPIHHPYQTLEQQKEATTVKKIDLNEFLMSLKSNEKALNPAEGLDKENVVPSQGLEDAAHSSGEFLYSHEPLNTCNVTRVFQGQEGGMEMTTCAADDVPVPCSIPGSVSSKTVFRGDKTVVFPKCDDMEMTGNYTDIIYNHSTTEGSNWQNSERQEQTHAVRAAHKVLITQGDSKRHFSVGKAFSSREDLKAPPSADGLSQRDVEGLAWTDTSQPCKGGSQVPLFGEKSAVFPSGESMDLTGNSAVVVPGNNINVVLSERKAALGYLVQVFAEEDMEITKPLHVALAGNPLQGCQPTQPLPSTSTILFSGYQAAMDITEAHTVDPSVGRDLC